MTTTYPVSLDNYANPLPSDNQGDPVTHATQHGNHNDAIEAIEAFVGVKTAAIPTTVVAAVTAAAAAAASGISAWSSTIDYVAGDSVIGSDLMYYKAAQASGPATTPRDPVSNPTYWYGPSDIRKPPLTVATVAAMKALTGLANGTEVATTVGYTSAGKGSGRYRASTTVVTPNGGTKINNDAATLTFHLVHGGEVDITQFGALVDNSTNDHVAAQACLDAASAENFTPTHNDGVSRVAAKLTVPDFVTFKGRGVFSKNANIDMCELGNGAGIQDIKWQGRGATYTGRGVLVSVQGDQKIHDCDITDMDGYCVEYIGAGTAPGVRSTIRGGVQYRTNVALPAIKYPDDALTGDRSMTDMYAAGGQLADFGGGENILVYGCNTSNFLFSAAPRKVSLVCNRIATSGANLVIAGQEHVTSGNLVAGQIELAAGTNNCSIGPDTTIGALIDNSGVSNNRVYGHYADFVPVWTAASVNPSLGNGTIVGRMTRDGRRTNFVIELTMGSTTTFGTGAYTFRLPPPYDTWTVKRSVGSARAFDSGTNFRIGVALTVTGVFGVTIYSDAGVAAWGPTNPFTFAVDDTIIIDVDCEMT